MLTLLPDNSSIRFPTFRQWARAVLQSGRDPVRTAPASPTLEMLQSLPREITAEASFDITFSPGSFKVLFTLRRIALVSATFPIHKLKWPAFFCGVNASVVVGPESCR